MQSANRIIIRAPREQIFATVRSLERWPERLPHYRYVRVLAREGDRQTVAMSARRGVVPVSWVSAYWTDETKLELHFEHLQKWTKGMKVVWTLTPVPEGTQVEITHALKFRLPWLAWFAEPIIGSFIEAIAGRTLAVFKELIEAGEGKQS